MAVISLKVSAKFTRNKFKNITASYLLTSYIISICQNNQNVEPLGKIHFFPRVQKMGHADPIKMSKNPDVA